MLATVLAFSLETGKIGIPKDHLLPRTLVGRVCSRALFEYEIKAHVPLAFFG